MKAKLNSLLDDVSGKFGDNVFARNPSGLYLRKNTLAEQPNSERQMNHGRVHSPELAPRPHRMLSERE